MIGLDTNLLVRYSVRKDPVQAGIATTIYRNSLHCRYAGFELLSMVS